MRRARVMDRFFGGLLAILVIAIAAASLVPEQSAGAAGPAQPTQPASGPGGADYAHADWLVQAGGTGDDAWFVFQPASPTPASAPLVIMLHGYYEFSGYD